MAKTSFFKKRKKRERKEHKQKTIQKERKGRKKTCSTKMDHENKCSNCIPLFSK